LDGKTIKNFQMPMYIKLYEQAAKLGTGGEAGSTLRRTVDGAYFFSINQNELRQIVGSLKHKRGSSREKYQATLDALDDYAEKFRSALGDLNFSPDIIPFKKCFSCSYRTICRSLYSLNSTAKNKELSAVMQSLENEIGEEDDG
jgi:hypothetical protein